MDYQRVDAKEIITRILSKLNDLISAGQYNPNVLAREYKATLAANADMQKLYDKVLRTEGTISH